MKWLREFWCGLRGHDHEMKVEPAIDRKPARMLAALRLLSAGHARMDRMKTMAREILIVACICGLGVGMAALAANVSAQKAERGTQHWLVPVPPTGMGQFLHVFDMSGTCVYVYEASGFGGVAAISKAQLPQGAGCQ